MSVAIGWAVTNSSGKILVRTVSDTRRAAIVNYLVTEHQCPVHGGHSDEDINHMWAHYGKYAECREVSIVASIPLQDRGAVA